MKTPFEKEPHFENESSFWTVFWKWKHVFGKVKSNWSFFFGYFRFDPVSESRKQLETCSNVVSSTMEDEDSSSREGLTPLTTVKVRISYVFCIYTGW